MRQSYRQMGGPAPRGPECPSFKELSEYEAGLRTGKSDEDAAGILDHIADCEACAALIADMQGTELQGEDGEASSEKTGILLRSSTKAWQETMLSRIARELGGEKQRSSKQSWTLSWVWPRWAAVAAAVVAIVGAVWWNSASHSPDAAFRLIAEAYTEQRPFELRIPGAAHSPLRTERGPSASPGVALLDAQRMIASQLEKKSPDVDWLRASARADLMQSHYSAAIEFLRRAEAAKPGNPAILGDLGIAYLQRAEMESRPQDIAPAIEYLSKAVTGLPSEPAYRFNLALAYERQLALRQALEEWNGLLGREPSGAWAGEARQHVERIQKLLKDQAGRAKAPRTSEDAITALAAVGFRSTPSMNADAIAADLAEMHGDPWMQDFLKANRTTPSQSALAALEAAAKAYTVDKSSEGETRSREAAEAFRRAHNVPGALFAAFEESYGFQRLSQSESCLEVAGAALPGTQSQYYRWIEARLNLTRASCFIMQRRFDRAHEAILAAQGRAEEAGFDSLTLRSLILRAENLRTLGSYREALEVDAEGLRRYWSGVGNLTHGYQLYYDMGIATASLHHFRAASALLNEAVELTRLLPNRMVEAMARSRYADVLLEDGQTHQADAQFQESESAFRGLPDSPDALLYGSYVGLSRARLDGQVNRTSQGLERLDRLEPKLADIRNPAVEALLWRTKSELLIRAGRIQDSEGPLHRILALGTAQRNRSSDIGDSSELDRQVAQAVGILTDRRLQSGRAAEAWRLWTEYNPCFRTIPANSPDTARVIFTELPSGPVVWVSDTNGIQAERLQISNQDLERSAVDFRRAAANRNEPVGEIRSLAGRLYAQIFAPVEKHLRQARVLYIAADGAFASIPFAALVSQDGQWLGDRYQVMYSPPLAGVLPQASTALSPDLNVVAASYGQAAEVLQTVFPSLPDVEADMRAVSDALPHHTLLRNQQATVESVLGALPSAGILHFSGHSLITAGDAALVLAPADPANPERLLWASKIPAQSLRRCRLVMLAACSTGRAADEDNDPSSVMARTFLLRGVPEVIASRWDVDSSATSFLVARFYQAVAKGASAEEALSSSVQQLRRQPAFAHPYFWAAFDLFRS